MSQAVIERAEELKTRYVATTEGEQRYGKPIGSEITSEDEESANEHRRTTMPDNEPRTVREYRKMFAKVSTDEWGGGDIGISHEMPDGRRVWLFGDTFSNDNGLVRNSAMVQKDGKLHVSRGGKQLLPSKRRDPDNPKRSVVYWPDGVRQGPNKNTLIVTSMEMSVGKDGPWDFQQKRAGESRAAVVRVTSNGDLVFLRWKGYEPTPTENNPHLANDFMDHGDGHYSYGTIQHDIRLADGSYLTTRSHNWTDDWDNHKNRDGSIRWQDWRPTFGSTGAKSLIERAAEYKGVRRVRTPAGQRRFGQPIGSIIVADGRRLSHLSIGESPYDDWQLAKGKNGKEYYTGKEGGKWIATEGDDWDKVVAEARSEEELYTRLNDVVKGGRGTSKPATSKKPASAKKPAPKPVAKKPVAGTDPAKVKAAEKKYGKLKPIKIGGRTFGCWNGSRSGHGANRGCENDATVSVYLPGTARGNRYACAACGEEMVDRGRTGAWMEAGHNNTPRPKRPIHSKGGPSRKVIGSRAWRISQKDVRHVRTPEGAAHYGQPIGSVIRRDAEGNVIRDVADRAGSIAFMGSPKSGEPVARDKRVSSVGYTQRMRSKARDARFSVAQGKGPNSNPPNIKGSKHLWELPSDYEGYDLWVDARNLRMYVAQEDDGMFVAYDVNSEVIEEGDNRADLIKKLEDFAAIELKPGCKWATPADRKRLVTPPAWRSVQIPIDQKTTRMKMQGYDSKGKQQTQYTAEQDEIRDAVKFERTKQLQKKMRVLDAYLKKNTGKENSDCIMMMRRLGMRPDRGESGADVETFGATSLQAKHVKVSPTGLVTLKFTPGKKKEEVTIKVRDKVLADMLRERLKDKSHSKPLFEVNVGKVEKEFRNVVGQGFNLKDLRTLKANAIAMEMMLKKKDAVPKNKSEFNKWRREVLVAVSDVLGNTPDIVKKSYVNPVVFEQWAVDPAWLK